MNSSQIDAQAVPIPVLGIVGGIGSGKSHIASLFAKHGAVVVDADKLGHQALLDPAIMNKVMKFWGPVVFHADGSVDRKKLGQLVFSDQAEKARLESVVFPFIGKGIRDALEQAACNPAIKLAVLDAAIMLETGWRTECTAVIFVDAEEAIRLQRVRQRGWDAAELHRREAAQWPLEKKKSMCQHIISNNGDEVSTERLVIELINRYSRP